MLCYKHLILANLIFIILQNPPISPLHQTYGKYKLPTGSVDTALLNPAGEANTYVRFGYGPHKIWNNIQGNFSGSIHTYTINANLEPLKSIGISELINYLWKLWTPNRKPHHYLTQSYRARKLMCPVLIRPTENLQQHPKTSIRTNTYLYNWFQSTIT